MAGLRSPTVDAEKSAYSQQPASIREQLQNLASELRRDSRTNSRDDEDNRESAHAVAVETREAALNASDVVCTLTPAQEKGCRNGASFTRRFTPGRYRLYAESGEFLARGEVRDWRMETVKSFFAI